MEHLEDSKHNVITTTNGPDGSLIIYNAAGTVVSPSTGLSLAAAVIDQGTRSPPKLLPKRNITMAPTQALFGETNMPFAPAAGLSIQQAIPSMSTTSQQLQQQQNPSNIQALVKDQRRRQKHNEVERSRRDAINKGIQKLKDLIPESYLRAEQTSTIVKQESSSSRQQNLSKGEILDKGCDYLQDLTRDIAERNCLIQELHNQKAELERRNEELAQINERVSLENAHLKGVLNTNSISLPEMSERNLERTFINS